MVGTVVSANLIEWNADGVSKDLLGFQEFKQKVCQIVKEASEFCRHEIS